MFFRCFIVFLFAFASHAVADETILSKDDAKQMFELSFNEWKQNVEYITSLGMAEAQIESPLEITLIADVPNGRVLTTPSYESENSTPSRLFVTIVFTPPESFVFLAQDDMDRIRLINEVYEEMLPEYTVLTDIEVYTEQEVVVKNYKIFPNGLYPVLDQAALASKGCWKECIQIK